MTTGPTPPRPRAFRLPSESEGAAPPAAAPPPSAAESPAPKASPRAYRLDAAAERRIDIAEQPDPYALEIEQALSPTLGEEAAIEKAQAKGMAARGPLSLGALFWSAIGGLVSLGVGLSITRLIDDLFARFPGLGWLGVALLALAGLALLGIGIREAIGIGRQRRVAVLHKALAEAHAADDGKAARRLVTDLSALYAKRPETAAARKEMTALAGEIIDGRDLIDLAERHLMGPIDRAVRREIADAAKRVSLVTAISPRAILDLVFVIAQIVRLIRRIAELYSGRPGLLGFMRLARSVGMHLAITGGMAVGESVLQQAIGHGLAAKVSARLGEGVLNGILTTRVGLSAMAVCRPMPFAALKQPGAKEVAPFLFGDRGA